MATGRKTGGRRRGTPNRATAEIRAHAQQYTVEALEGLAQIARTSQSDAARVAAWNALLDRGHGKPIQGVDLGVEVAITRIERLIVDPQALEASLVSIVPTNGAGGHPAEDCAARTPDGGARRASALPTSVVIGIEQETD